MNGMFFTTLWTLSPVGDMLTLNLAKALVENERAGEDEIPDYVGHLFGPSSLKSESMLLKI